MNSEFVITKRKIKDLRASEYNPRKLSKGQKKSLKESLTRFGLAEPVVVNVHEDRKDIVVGGHQRIKIWKELGNETIPTVSVCLKEEDERELNIRLNKNTGAFDLSILAQEFDVSDLESWGFEQAELLNKTAFQEVITNDIDEFFDSNFKRKEDLDLKEDGERFVVCHNCGERVKV